MPLPEDEHARRLAAWRAEADSASDRGQKGILWYEIGVLSERAGATDEARKAYDEARKLAPKFRPALWAAVRLAERRRDAKALSDLYAAEARAARSPAEEASALVDQAVLYEDFLGRGKQARPLYERALKTDAASVPAALMLELHLRRAGDAAAAMQVAAGRSSHVQEPVLKRLLYAEAALASEAEGRVDEAVEFLRTLTREPLERWRLLELLEAMALRHDRSDVLREVRTRMAELAEARSKGDNIGQGLSAGSLPPFANERDARDRAAVLFHELARAGDDTALERALALRPDDPLLRFERLEQLERAGDAQAALEAAAALAADVDGPAGAALQLRLADLARAADKPKMERRALEAAARLAPSSAAVTALAQDRLLAQSTPAERVAWLEGRAAAGGTTAAEALWRAAQIAADDLGDAERAGALYERAAREAADPAPVLREMLGAGLRLGAPALIDAASRGLADTTSDERERAMLLLERWRQDRHIEGRDPLAALRDAMDDPAAGAWAADVARFEAAAAGDHGLLARAHAALAARASDDAEAAAAHLCAAARAHARDGDLDDAVAALHEARARRPGHAYAAVLLEEVLREGGQGGEVISLLAEAARESGAGRDAEPLLLRAATIAESMQDASLAAAMLREAAEANPKSIAPLAQLRRLAASTGDGELAREALEALARREAETGRPGRAHLSLAEHLLAAGDSEDRIVELLRACFADDTLGALAAATMLLAANDPTHEVEALERLLRDARGHGAAGLRRRLGVLLRGTERERELRALLPRIREVRRDDRWAPWVELARAEAHSERIDALEGLAGVTRDDALAAELLLEARAIAAIAGGDGAADRERALGERVARAAGDGLLSALVGDERWCADEDATTRVERLRARLKHASPELRPQVAAALGRAHVLREEPAEAVAALRDALAGEPDDLACWEAMRIAARQAEAWAELVPACERLAALAEGPPRARLLEEAAVALIDHLGRRTDGERRLRDALKADPASDVAFRRLHDALTERNDADGLLELVSARIGAVDDPAELVVLLDEQARLRHDRGDLEGTVAALLDLQVLDPGNAGALALLAESSARLERWEEAVEALRSLSCVDIPADERRQARLAASRYARERLGDVDGALADLRVIDGMGLADESLYVHMAEVAEAAGKHADAAAALASAASVAGDPADRARYERRAAELYTDVLDSDAAVAAYRRALEAAPTDLAAAEGLAALLDPEPRREVARAFQDALRERLAVSPTAPGIIRKLRRSATWCGERDLEMRALSALVALDQASQEERAALEALRAEAPARMTGSLGQALAGITPEFDGSLRALVAAADDAVATFDDIEPGALGVGRRDVVKEKHESALRREVIGIAAELGLDCDRFFEGGNDPERIEVIPQGDKPPAWVVGGGVAAPLSPRERFRVAALAVAVRNGTTCLVRRTPEEGEALLHALAMAADQSLGTAPAEASDLAGPLKKAMSRKARRSVADAARTAPTEPDAVGDFCRAARLAALRAGLVAGGDLAAALEGARGSERGELILFWLSRDARRAREALGLALAETEVGDVDTSEATAERAPVPVTHAATVEQLLEQVVAANPYAAKAATGSLEVVGGASSKRERLALLLQLAERHDGRVRARLSTAAAELLETLGGDEPARELIEEALALDPDDLVALRRVRSARAREGRWEDVVALLEREAALPVAPEERAFALTLASYVSLYALSDAKAAENAARRAFMIRPQSAAAAAWLARTQRALGKDGDAGATLERAAPLTADGALGAVWLVEAARDAEGGSGGVAEGESSTSGRGPRRRRGGTPHDHEGGAQIDHARARRLYRQAHRLDPDAFDAAIGLARAARADGDPREAGRALHEAAPLLTDSLLREAFQVAGARIVHRAAGQPAEATRMLADVGGAEAALARVEAARGGTPTALAEALQAFAEASRRTERALAWVELAEARAEAGDVDAALAALREAGHADQTLTTLRVLREELARRTGDPLRLARATRAAGHGPAVAAARVALRRDALSLERSLLREAQAEDRTARVVALDAAAEAGDAAAAAELLGSDPTAIGAALALAERHASEGRADDARAVLAGARERAPGDAPSRRWLAALSEPADAALLWMEEAVSAPGALAAFAAGNAARLFLRADDAESATLALRTALEAAPGYLTAVWILEEHAREGGDDGELRDLLRAGEGEETDSAGALVRSAVIGERPDRELLARAYAAAPDDAVLADLLLRAWPDAPARDRAELFARQAERAPGGWARALRLRAAWAYEEAGEHAEAAAQAHLVRAAAEGPDPFVERLLDRVEPAAGMLDQAADRLVEATAEAPDDLSRALAFERYARFEMEHRGDLEAAANPLY